MPRTSFEVKKDQKNVFLIEDPDSEEDQGSPNLVAPVIIHRMSDEKERPALQVSQKDGKLTPRSVQEAVAAEAISIENQLEQVESVEVAANLSGPEEEEKKVANNQNE